MSWKPSAAILQATIDGWMASAEQALKIMAMARDPGHYPSIFVDNSPGRDVPALECLEMETKALCVAASGMSPHIDLSKFWAVFNSVKLWSDRYGAEKEQEAQLLKARSDLAIAEAHIPQLWTMFRESPDDPLQVTIGMLTARGQRELVRFLANRDGREASLKTIAHDLNRRPVVKDDDERSARKCAERTRDSLEARRCPLRLVIHAGAVRLTDADQPLG